MDRIEKEEPKKIAKWLLDGHLSANDKLRWPLPGFIVELRDRVCQIGVVPLEISNHFA